MIPSLWFAAVLGSQFYIFPSGMPQPAHVLTAVLFMCYIFRRRLLSSLGASKHIIYALTAFVFYLLCVNIAWSIVESDPAFLINSVFWVFSYLVAVVMLCAVNSDTVRSSVKWAAFAGVVFLAAAWVLKVGRFNYGSRYNGFFNDPNQMAFWVLCATAVFLNLSSKLSKTILVVLCAASLVAVLSTMSRSALLGVGFILFGMFLRFLGFQPGESRVRSYVYIVVGLALFPVLLYFLTGSGLAGDVIQRFAQTDFAEQADLRGYGRLTAYPEYLLFGAGQALDSRFESKHEIHSSWVAILFYYGVVGLALFSFFIYKIFIRLDLSGKFVFVAPMFYGLSTYGLRSPVFWIFIASTLYVVNTKKFSR